MDKNFRPIFKFGYYIFNISIIWTRFEPEFSLVQIVWFKKNKVLIINFLSEF